MFIYGNKRRCNFQERAAIASLIHPSAPRAEPVGRTKGTCTRARARARARARRSGSEGEKKHEDRVRHGSPSRSAPALRGFSPRHCARGPHPSQHAPARTRKLPIFRRVRSRTKKNATLPGSARRSRVALQFRFPFSRDFTLISPPPPNPAGGTGPARPAPNLRLICAGLSREPGCSFLKSPFASVPVESTNDLYHY